MFGIDGKPLCITPLILRIRCQGVLQSELWVQMTRIMPTTAIDEGLDPSSSFTPAASTLRTIACSSYTL